MNLTLDSKGSRIFRDVTRENVNKRMAIILFEKGKGEAVSYTHLDVYKRQRDAIQRALVPDPADPYYIVALNLLSRSPTWLGSMGARPMYLGLDLRGGVHFMLQVDMEGALTKRAESLSGDIRTTLRDKNVRHSGISRDGQTIQIKAPEAQTARAIRNILTDQFTDLVVNESPDGAEVRLTATIKPEAARRVQDLSLIHI